MPGQFALLRLPSKADAPRAYSMAGLPNDHGVWTFCIKRVPHGRFTSALFDRVRPGDAVALNGPFGHAYLRADSCRDLLCIAGGSGLAPIASIARGALASDEPVRRVSVFYGCRTAADVVEPGDIGLDDRGGGRLEFTVAISEAGDAGWTGARGPIHEVAAGLLGDALALCDVYVAGPSPMVQATLRLLLDRGVPRAQIYYDSFY
jgi:toluene monooxygenase electron transfer component